MFQEVLLSGHYVHKLTNGNIHLHLRGSRYLPGGRQFEVFINSLTAEPHADVIFWTKHGRVSIYKDYVVIVSKKGKENKQNITIHLHPLLAVYDDAVNGIEVFKMNILMAIWVEPTMNY
ncbi:hypothetical protein V6Z12_D10G092600 [Gossypium hirsutum]